MVEVINIKNQSEDNMILVNNYNFTKSPIKLLVENIPMPIGDVSFKIYVGNWSVGIWKLKK